MKEDLKKPAANFSKNEIADCMNEIKCPECKGQRLKKESLSVTVGGMNIMEFTELSVSEALDFINKLSLTEREINDRRKNT